MDSPSSEELADIALASPSTSMVPALHHALLTITTMAKPVLLALLVKLGMETPV